MKLYKIQSGIVIERANDFALLKGEDWDTFINEVDLFAKMEALMKPSLLVSDGHELIEKEIMAPVGRQELWACGVTYLRSKIGRQEESKDGGGGDFYERVYAAERPEVFFKSTPHRIVGHGGLVRIRKDSSWNVPEPELTLVVNKFAKIVGYTIGNDMSSRSIEGENPSYLPQAKTYDGCAAVGPCLLVTRDVLDPATTIRLEIIRGGKGVFEGNVAVSQMKRTFSELVSFVFRECSFPYGCLVMTGTGIVPANDFTLWSKDEIRITIDGIGTLVNSVQ